MLVFAALLFTTPSLGETVAVLRPDLGLRAAAAFKETCLVTRGQGIDAAVSAILARAGAKEGPNLPVYGSGKHMRTFSEGELEYLVRPGKGKKYGCFVAFEGGEQLANSARSALDGLAGIANKPVNSSKKVYFEWTITGSRDEIRLTPKSELGSILINLEVLS